MRKHDTDSANLKLNCEIIVVLVSLRQLLDHAVENIYVIPAFNDGLHYDQECEGKEVITPIVPGGMKALRYQFFRQFRTL